MPRRVRLQGLEGLEPEDDDLRAGVGKGHLRQCVATIHGTRGHDKVFSQSALDHPAPINVETGDDALRENESSEKESELDGRPPEHNARHGQ